MMKPDDLLPLKPLHFLMLLTLLDGERHAYGIKKDLAAREAHREIGPGTLYRSIAQLIDNARTLEKELARLKSKLASSQGDDLASQAIDVKGVKVVAAHLEGADAKGLREAVDKARSMKVNVRMHGNGFVVKQSPAPGGRWGNDETLLLQLEG